MVQRTYVQSRRAEAAAETRRRIVEATFTLHAEQGVAATSMKQIAERAGVSVGTVYHHFPTYDDAIAACGAHVFSLAPPPDERVFENLTDPRERIAALFHAAYGQYRTVPMMEAARSDQHVSPVLRQVFAEEAQRRAGLARQALGPAAEDRELARLAAGLLDIGVWSALTRAGLTTEAAARAMAEAVASRLPPNPS
ncbi:TetR/AcrR family transcriptional regulator [Phenylobacterium terrae]|uniref:TetR/AcrR family transcriptional regulator n=1 Tax=Phenylobacterium terrae TaxID=2665495 RepID=A0ABW4MY35_9CAUL